MDTPLDLATLFCAFVDGLVPTQADCARNGCRLCAGELDEIGDDSWLEG